MTKSQKVLKLVFIAVVMLCILITCIFVLNQTNRRQQISSHTASGRGVPLADLPDDYGRFETIEQMVSDGVYINVQGQDIYNQDIVDDFYVKALTGEHAFMRVVQYTVEGDPILTDYQFNGRIYTVTSDFSRDQFGDVGNKNFIHKTYKHLIPDDRSGLSDLPVLYYLSNAENIYTEDGSLIDDLGLIPSPSNSFCCSI